MRFSKWHGLGNEYVVLDGRQLDEPVDRALVRRVCDPHTGVGSDGILEIVALGGNRVSIVIWNPDGSQAELSGNGTRIMARWLARELGVAAVEIAVGERVVAARMLDELMVEQDIGSVEVGETENLVLPSESLEFTPVNLGNPHAVIRHDPREDEVERIGPLVERHERFPQRTNVQLVRVDGAHELTVGVWERGAGVTASSGTSAVAAAAATCAQEWTTSPVTVALPGGELAVSIAAEGATLTGPAQEICTGELAPQLLADLGRDV